MADMCVSLTPSNRNKFHELCEIARFQCRLVCAEAGCECGHCLDITDRGILLGGSIGLLSPFFAVTRVMREAPTPYLVPGPKFLIELPARHLPGLPEYNAAEDPSSRFVRCNSAICGLDDGRCVVGLFARQEREGGEPKCVAIKLEFCSGL